MYKNLLLETEKLFEVLPQSLRRKKPNEANGVKKLLKIANKQFYEIYKNIEAVQIIDDDISIGEMYLNHLSEHDLKRLADNYGIVRGEYDKERFKRYIVAKVNSFLNTGNIESIKELLGIVFNENKEAFRVEDYTQGVFKVSIPSSVNGREAVENIEMCKAAGIGFVLTSYSRGIIELIINKLEGNRPLKSIRKKDQNMYFAREADYMEDGVIVKGKRINDGMVASTYTSRNQLIVGTRVEGMSEKILWNR